MKVLFPILWSAICGAVSVYVYFRLQASKERVKTDSDTEPLHTDWKICILIAVLGFVSGGVCGYYTADNTDWINNMKLLVGFCVLLAAAFYDYRTFKIPNHFVVWLPVCRLFFLAIEFLTGDVNRISRLLSSLAGAVFCLIVLILFSFLSKGGIGMGDIKLLSGLGFLLGFYSIIYILVLSCMASFILSVILLITGKKKMKDAIPMAPAILIGYIAVLMLGLY